MSQRRNGGSWLFYDFLLKTVRSNHAFQSASFTGSLTMPFYQGLCHPRLLLRTGLCVKINIKNPKNGKQLILTPRFCRTASKVKFTSK